jgi:exopolysaccharide production protein ExoZ
MTAATDRNLHPPSQLLSLQILRAVAAASVVYYHIDREPRFGSFGVDLFFVLSGFVIAMIAGTRSSATEFALNRITRVAPLYWVLTAAILVVAMIAPRLLTATSANAGDFLRSILFIPYFKSSGALQPMLGVGWTLNYEMLFYALATLSLAFWRKPLFPVVTTVLVAAAWLLGRMLPDHSAYGEFLSSQLVFEFALGVFAWNAKDWRVWRHVPTWGLLAMVLVLYTLMAYFETISASYRLLSYGIPAFLIVVTAFQLEQAISRAPHGLVRCLVHIGDASYATYLSHLYCVDFAKRVLVKQLGSPALASWPGAFGMLVASLAMGSLIYALIDKPAVRAARRIAKGMVRRRLASKTAQSHS